MRRPIQNVTQLQSRPDDTRKDDPQFAAAWEDAIAGSVDELEAVAFKLASEGDSSPYQLSPALPSARDIPGTLSAWRSTPGTSALSFCPKRRARRRERSKRLVAAKQRRSARLPGLLRSNRVDGRRGRKWEDIDNFARVAAQTGGNWELGNWELGSVCKY